MFANYLKMAWKVLRRRKFFTFVSLFGIGFTLTTLMVVVALVDHVLAPSYPEVSTDNAHVDATCMWMVKNPEWFDVIVTDNMFGDIITDLAAMIHGGMGIAAGANINPDGVSMFEPIGGSAPRYTGKQIINPIAAISSAQIMLETLGENQAASWIEQGIIKVLRDDLKDVAAGKMGYTTQEVGDLVVDYIESIKD